MANDLNQTGDKTPQHRSFHQQNAPRQYEQSPDDFGYEGDITDLEPLGAPWSVDADDAVADAVDFSGDSGDEAYVTVDNPDDFE